MKISTFKFSPNLRPEEDEVILKRVFHFFQSLSPFSADLLRLYLNFALFWRIQLVFPVLPVSAVSLAFA